MRSSTFLPSSNIIGLCGVMEDLIADGNAGKPIVAVDPADSRISGIRAFKLVEIDDNVLVWVAVDVLDVETRENFVLAADRLRKGSKLKPQALDDNRRRTVRSLEAHKRHTAVVGVRAIVLSKFNKRAVGHNIPARIAIMGFRDIGDNVDIAGIARNFAYRHPNAINIPAVKPLGKLFHPDFAR